MKKTGLAVFFVLVILLGLLAGQLGIAHLPGSTKDADTAPGPAVTEQAAEAPARDGEAELPEAGTEGAGQENAPAAPDGEAAADQEVQPAVPLPEGAEIINGEAVVHGTVEKGDTVSKIIEGNTASGSHPYVSAARQVFSMRAFRTGQPYTIVVDPASGQLKRFEYEIDARRRLVVEGVEEPVARVEAIEYVTTLAQVEASIDDNLFQAVADIGESPQLALALGNLFGSEINFIRDLQPGDSFKVLVEKRYRDGEYKGYGRVLAAHFTNKGTTYEAYLFRDGTNRPQHYNARGENLRKTLLQAPLAFTRVTSRFSHNRKHPILGYSRPHLGVDYGAPTGTPVKAVGDGVVTRRSWAGGYGNQVIIKHSAGLESMYSHLSGYARGLRNASACARARSSASWAARAFPPGRIWISACGRTASSSIRPRPSTRAAKACARPPWAGSARPWKRNAPCCWAIRPCWNMMWTASCPRTMWRLPPGSGHDAFWAVRRQERPVPCTGRSFLGGRSPL